jgi:hypothetical protein
MLAAPAQTEFTTGTGPAPSQHNDLLALHEDLGLHRRTRPEQVNHNRKKQSAEIQQSTKDHPILRFTPSEWNLR